MKVNITITTTTTTTTTTLPLILILILILPESRLMMHFRRTSSLLLSLLIVLPHAYIRGIQITLVVAALFESIILAMVAVVHIGEHIGIKDR